MWESKNILLVLFVKKIQKTYEKQTKARVSNAATGFYLLYSSGNGNKTYLLLEPFLNDIK